MSFDFLDCLVILNACNLVEVDQMVGAPPPCPVFPPWG